jgi:uncharacterized protein (DUF58 family)
VSARAAAGHSRRWNPFTPLSGALRARLAAWVRQRQGLDELPVSLARRRLYILPTRGGVAFAALLFVMLLAGLNYANSLALFLTFLLSAFALVGMQQCHRNLLGLSVIAVHAPAVFARRAATLYVTLGNTADAPRPRLEVALEESASACADLAAGAREELQVRLGPYARGVHQLGRVRIASAHPFGLFRAWTWVHTPLELVVYPAPLGALPMPTHSAQRPGTGARGGSEVDEWLGLRRFRDGDSPRQVDWKAYAREAPLLVKEYQPSGAELRLFDFAAVPLADTEGRLSQLARWVVDAEAQGERYGLTLPGVRVAPERGPAHRHRCLSLLARFGVDAARGGA